MNRATVPCGFAEAIAPKWEVAQAAFPSEGVFFLEPAFVAEACRAAFLPAEPMAAALEAAPRLAADPALAALAWYFHWCLWDSPSFPPEHKARWPRLDQVPPALLPDLAMIYLLVMTAHYREMQEVHRAHDVSPAIAEHTLLDFQLGGWTSLHEKHGCWGLDVFRLGWLGYHMRGEIYRLGRLQFQYAPFRSTFRVYRRHATGQVLTLSESGLRYLADGRFWTEKRAAEGQEDWTSELVRTETEVIGSPVSVMGRVLREPVRLDLTEWTQVLSPEDPVLHLHIPVGGPMDHAECGESFRWAAQWFPEHFPEWPYRAYVCNSWLLDTQLQEFLPPESNIARFQREMYLFPTISSDENLLGPIFHCMPEFTAAMPRETSLQRTLAAYLEAGHPLRASGGGSIILAEDLDWGAEIYLRGKAMLL